MNNPEEKRETTEQSTNEWDSLAQGPGEQALTAEDIKEIRAKRAAEAPKKAAEYYGWALDVQNDFDRRRQKILSEGGGMSEKEFERWEDELADNIKYAQGELEKTDGKLDTVAECEQHMIFSRDDTELHKTIEAQAGNFYHNRIAALREAILASDNATAAEEDLGYVKDFYPAVMEHLSFKYMTRDEMLDYDPDRYERNRTKAHNDVIKHLNGINDLARKYGVRPLTVRNFLPSDVRDKRGQTPAIASVMRYDRDVVEEYYAIAFSSELQRIRSEYDRKRRMGLY